MWTRVLLLSCLTIVALSHMVTANDQPPNFVVIFTDDQGYGDLSCFDADHVETPHIDRLAAEGARLTSFYVPASVCTPSRAGLMTGCYPIRNDMARGSNFIVLLASDAKGLHPDEITIAEVLKDAGYATGIFGKWHLGDQPDFLPTRQGFDEFVRGVVGVRRLPSGHLVQDRPKRIDVRPRIYVGAFMEPLR